MSDYHISNIARKVSGWLELHSDNSQTSGICLEMIQVMARHMWNGPAGKRFFQTFHPAGSVRSYVRRHGGAPLYLHRRRLQAI